MLLGELFQEVSHTLPYAVKCTTIPCSSCKKETVRDGLSIGAPSSSVSMGETVSFIVRSRARKDSSDECEWGESDDTPLPPHEVRPRDRRRLSINEHSSEDLVSGQRGMTKGTWRDSTHFVWIAEFGSYPGAYGELDVFVLQ